MPSWHDGSSSSGSLLGCPGDFTDMDYAPDTVEDPTFCGIADASPVVCRRHSIAPRKCVAFEGTNTGRKFYLCSVQHEVENCGFVDWVDGEWPETDQNALATLWGMYHESKNARNDDMVENGKLVKELSEEKIKMEKKYYSMVDDVNKFIDENCSRVRKENYARIMHGDGADVAMVGEKITVELLKKEVAELKQIQRTQADVMRVRQKEWDEEKEAMKEEKKKLEYMLYQMVTAKDATKEKMRRIKAICDE